MTTIHESSGIHAQRVTGHRYEARLIQAGRGSSGYYDAEMLERDGPTAFAAGTPVFLDHETLTEKSDRPERSVRDLAGKITTTPVMIGDGLYAEVEFYPHVAPVIEALWGDVGMSIRASGTAETAERDGQMVPVITSLTEGLSVDVVTRAGAGGKLVALLESARAESPAQNPPSHSAGVTEGKEAVMAHIQVDEAEHKRLTEAAEKLAAVEAERDAATKKAEDAAALIAEANRAADAAQAERVISAAPVAFTALEAKGLRVDMPVDESGRLDVPAFERLVKEAATEKAAESGAGRPSGMGTVTESTDITEADLDVILGITQKGA